MRNFHKIFFTFVSSAILTYLVVLLENKYGKDFIDSFFGTESLTIIGTFLAINAASITFLLGTMMSIESKSGALIFKESRNEVKQSFYFMFLISSMHFVLLLLDNQLITVQDIEVISFFRVYTFILFFFPVIELIRTAFTISYGLFNPE